MSIYARLALVVISTALYLSTSGDRDITKIIIHATDMDKTCGAKCIDKAHKTKGWEGCGYHYIVMSDGKIEVCRPEKDIGAHTKGYNKDSLGVAWAGKEGDLTYNQYESLLFLVETLIIKYNLSKDDVYGHNHFPTSGKKTCPIIDMVKFKKRLK